MSFTFIEDLNLNQFKFIALQKITKNRGYVLNNLDRVAILRYLLKN